MIMGDLILIDRSAMLEAIDKRERIVRKFAPDLQEDEIRPTLKSIREFIANRPIVDAEPVRRGQWVFDENANDWSIGGYVCSECQAKNNNLPCVKVPTPLLFVGANYCPNCGAKMDGRRAESHT